MTPMVGKIGYLPGRKGQKVQEAVISLYGRLLRVRRRRKKNVKACEQLEMRGRLARLYTGTVDVTVWDPRYETSGTGESSAKRMIENGTSSSI